MNNNMIFGYVWQWVMSNVCFFDGGNDHELWDFEAYFKQT